MFLRIVARSAARRLPSHACNTISRFRVNSAVPKSVRFFSKDAGKAAVDEYRSVVAELMADIDDSPTDLASVDTLLDWDKQKLDTLTLDQLEELGRAWFDGVDDDFPQDLTRAFEVWTVAAKLGSAESGYSRAVMIREGQGVPKDSAAAFQALLEVANSKNYGMAHFAVAIMLTSGEGVAQDHTQAFHHNWQAAQGGIIPAVHNIANAYASGQGVPKDETKAAHHYETAAHCGDPAAKFTLGTWLYAGKGGLTVDKKRAFQLQLEAAQAGHGVAMFNTGNAFLEGAVPETNYTEAAAWFEKAAQIGFPEAAVNLGMMYRRGMGEGETAVPKDLHKALEIFKKFSRIPMCAELAEDVQSEINESK